MPRNSSLYATIAFMLCVSASVPAHTQQSTPDTTSAPAAQSDTSTPAETPAPAKKHKNANQNQNGGNRKKNKKNQKNQNGPATALCNDGSISHQQPKTDKKGKPEQPCKKNGGVANKF